MAEQRPYVPPDRWQCEMCNGSGQRQHFVLPPEATSYQEYEREVLAGEVASFTTVTRRCAHCQGRGWNEWKGSPDARAAAEDFRRRS